MTWLLVFLTALLAGCVGFLIGCFLAAGVIGDLRQDKHKLMAYIDYLEAGDDVVAEAEDLLRDGGS